MILYHAVSSYQILECIVHKVSLHKIDKAILVTREFTKNRLGSGYDLLKQIFEEIIIYGPLRDSCIDEIKSRGFEIKDFAELYVACAHTWFGIYLCEHSIPFVFIEDGLGAISQPEILEKVNLDSAWIDLDLEYGLFTGENDNIKKCICNMKYQREGYHNEKADDFDVIEELAKLDSRAEIISIFTDLKDYKLKDDKKNIILLTEHFANLCLLEWEEQIYLYQIIVDYYFKDANLIIKPHPDDLMYYEELLDCCDVIREKFPSELIPFIFSKKPECIATISSTGIRSISNQFEETITFNYRFSYYEKEFYSLHRYFAAIRIYKENYEKKKALFFIGINEKIISNMKILSEYKVLDSLESLNDIPTHSFIICDKLDYMNARSKQLCKVIEQKNDSCIFLFLNTKDDYVFYDYGYKDIWKHVYPIEIGKKKRRKNNNYEIMDSEMIYLFYKGEINMETIKYSLKNTGIDVAISEFKGDKLKIKVLEGLLKATEQRLMYYINAEKEREKGTN